MYMLTSVPWRNILPAVYSIAPSSFSLFQTVLVGSIMLPSFSIPFLLPLPTDPAQTCVEHKPKNAISGLKVIDSIFYTLLQYTLFDLMSTVLTWAKIISNEDIKVTSKLHLFAFIHHYWSILSNISKGISKKHIFTKCLTVWKLFYRFPISYRIKLKFF
jgi:hypothetical protein